MVSPGALKPKVGDGIKSRRPLSAPVLHSFILFVLFCVCCCTSIGVYIIVTLRYVVACVYACKRVHTLPSQTCKLVFSVGFCEDATEGRTKKVKLLQRCFFIDPFLS